MFLLIQHDQQEGRPMGERSQRTLFQPAFNRGSASSVVPPI